VRENKAVAHASERERERAARDKETEIEEGARQKGVESSVASPFAWLIFLHFSIAFLHCSVLPGYEGLRLQIPVATLGALPTANSEYVLSLTRAAPADRSASGRPALRFVLNIHVADSYY
jgi:hypothetical protein